MNTQATELILGTVKLGNPDYGFSSSSPGKTNFDPIEFLQESYALGIHELDTAPRYGASEEIIGKFVRQAGQAGPEIRISSKVDHLTVGNPKSPSLMRESVLRSVERLGIASLHTCYLHQNDSAIARDPWILEGAARLKQERLIQEFGVSVYSEAEFEAAQAIGEVNVIQAAVSVCDSRFYDLQMRHKSPKRLIARSVLLQGALVNRERIAERVRSHSEMLGGFEALDTVAKRLNIPVETLALRFVGSLPGLHHAIIGTTSIINLKSNLQALRQSLLPEVREEILRIARLNGSWVNPRNW